MSTNKPIHQDRQVLEDVLRKAFLVQLQMLGLEAEIGQKEDGTDYCGSFSQVFHSGTGDTVDLLCWIQL